MIEEAKVEISRERKEKDIEVKTLKVVKAVKEARMPRVGDHVWWKPHNNKKKFQLDPGPWETLESLGERISWI